MRVAPPVSAVPQLESLSLSCLALVLLFITVSGCRAASNTVNQRIPPAGPVAPQQAQATEQTAGLVYRVLLREGQTNDRLESGEKVTLEVEVTNTSSVTAREVLIRLSGTPVLAEQFANPVPLGDLPPHEMKRVVLSARVPATAAVAHGELGLSIEAANGSSPVQKKFPLEWHPGDSPVASGNDVDRIPEGLPAFAGKKNAGIAIGLTSFRDPALPPIPFAAHDAEVMADYFKSFVGIPPERIQVLTDDHALKDDFLEVFEEWLPKHVEVGSEVMIFIAGRAVVNPSSGAISLLPHEADPADGFRLVSLRRLHEALARLPIQRALLMMDLTLTRIGSDPSSNGKEPAWAAMPAELRGGKLVQMVGMSGHEQVHQYEEGRHGLFTYVLLKGLRGAADRDQNGVVALGELCGYIEEHVPAIAMAVYHQSQHPLCAPSMASGSAHAGIPVSRVK